MDGMAHYTSMLANAVSKNANINVSIIVPKNFTSDYIDSNIEIIQALETPIRNNIKNMFVTLKNMSIVNKVSPDIIHLTSSYPPINIMLRIFSEYPIVLTVHDPNPHNGEIKFNWRSLLTNISEKSLFNKANKIIVHNDILKIELMKKKIFPEKISVIPHGDYSLFTRYQKDLCPIKNNILFFGRILDYKGLDYLLRAMTIISKEIPDIKLVIAGKGNILKYKNLINKNKIHIEIHNDWIPDNLVAELFEKTQLLILPYTEATQSGPLHIAYAFKKPVIATNVGALSDTVEDGKTGLLIPQKDVDALAGSIIKLLKEDKIREKMGQNAFLKMKKDMSWKSIAEKTIEVYKDIIG